MILYKCFGLIAFLLALHCNLNQLLHSTDFVISVTYENTAITISTDTNVISKSFTASEAENGILTNKDLYIGTYTLTVVSDVGIAYNVKVSAPLKFVNITDERFQALTISSSDPIKLSVIANKDPDGTVNQRPLFNDQVVIEHSLSDPNTTIELSVDHYCLANDITAASNNSSHFNITYSVESL